MSQPRLSTFGAALPQISPQPTTKQYPDIATVLPWRTWADGLAEAKQRQVPIVALAEPSWANSTQRLRYVLEQDEKVRTLVAERVVPILVDPHEHPDLVSTWRWTSIALTGTSGPPLLVFLTHEGHPFLSYCTMTPEGDDRYPSLASLIESTASAYAENAEAFHEEARAWANGARTPNADTAGSTGPNSASDRWDALRSEMNAKFGGVNELPKHPHPQLLWAMLDEHARGTLPDDLTQWGQTTLDHMTRGAMYDQIDRGFHRCARDEMWIAPHFEKVIPLNAQLTAVYGRAADQFENRELREIANQTLMLCSVALQTNVDVIASDSEYYTWTSPEIVRQLEPAVVQVISLHFGIQPTPARLALRRAVEMEQMDRYSREDVETLRARLVKGKAQLLMLRQQRQAPATIAIPALSWRAETIRWLLIASEWMNTVDLPALEKLLDGLTTGRFQAGQGYVRLNADAGWLEDQAAILGAFVAAHRALGSQQWLDRAKELADVMLAHYTTDTGWVDTPGAATPSFAVADDVIPAAISTATAVLTDLSQALNDPSYAEKAAKYAAAHRAMFETSGYWSASMWPTLTPAKNPTPA